MATDLLNQSDLLLAHKYRLSLETAPRQSKFRVVALIFLKEDAFNKASSTSSSAFSASTTPGLVCYDDIHQRPYLLGTNAEACWIGNSICAERSALTQLRWYPKATTIVDKIVICTDAPDAIAPGMMCREFMASCDQIPWDTPIVLGGTKCRRCSKNCTQDEDDEYHSNHDNEGEAASVSVSCCIDGNANHDFLCSVVSLASLYPHPSLYVRSNPEDCLAFGKRWESALLDSENTLLSIARDTMEVELNDVNHDHNSSLHPIHYVAAVMFRDRSYATASSVKSLEYGCSLDAITQLAPILKTKRAAGKEAMHLVQVDQFGLAHAPFSTARAFLVEQGYGHISVMIHDFDMKRQSLCWKSVKASELTPMVPDFVKQLKYDTGGQQETSKPETTIEENGEKEGNQLNGDTVTF